MGQAGQTWKKPWNELAKTTKIKKLNNIIKHHEYIIKEAKEELEKIKNDRTIN